MCGVVAKSCPTLVTPWSVACQAPLSMRFSKQGYWSGVPFLSPGDVSNPGIKPRSTALQADSLLTEPQGKLCGNSGYHQFIKYPPWPIQP